MTDVIPDAAVALSLMLEALSLLDGPEHSKAATHLRDAIEALSPQKQQSNQHNPGQAEHLRAKQNIDIAISLVKEALGLLDQPTHTLVASHLRQAISVARS
ncbi:hypothetical protein [Bradyrhizobium lablabi]|uniref:hypothetical protein n=1 Tax=Bradyrhizobium lablabi TaxID=722472 RepID=UPI001BA61D0C|nr:hypothetical protein [Bradyrhizobium lablabi]MBR0698121.1 hypothetical protein [Bradyrhizobium lablabi]